MLPKIWELWVPHPPPPLAPPLVPEIPPILSGTTCMHIAIVVKKTLKKKRIYLMNIRICHVC